MSEPPLPDVIRYAQALGFPLASLIIAGASVWFAHQQLKLASLKTQNDLFDRRFAVYKGIAVYMSSILKLGKSIPEAEADYWSAIAPIEFLFDRDIVHFARKYVYGKAVGLNLVNNTMTAYQSGKETADVPGQRAAAMIWFVDELRALSTRFRVIHLQPDRWREAGIEAGAIKP